MVMKGSYFGFGSLQQQVDMHARSKNTFIVIICIYLPYDSQTIRLTIHLLPLLCVMLICGDWSHFHFIMPVMPDKAALKKCCFVYSVTGETAIFTAPKAAPSGKELICIFIQTNKWAGNMLMFHVDVNMKRLGIRFKNDSFQWFRVDSLFWETITLYTVHFQI